MKMSSLLLFAVLISGCAKFKTIMRIKPQVSHVDGFLISNSQTNPYKLNLDEANRLVIDYSIIVKNIEDSPAPINLEKAQYKANEEQCAINCQRTLGSKTNFTLMKNEQASIQCHVTIDPNEKNKLQLSDTDIIISIPLNKNTHTFTYRVYAEEFSK